METSQGNDVRSELPEEFDRNGRGWNHFNSGTEYFHNKSAAFSFSREQYEMNCVAGNL